MSQAISFADKLRRTQEAHLNRYLQAVEREKFGQPLTLQDYIQDSRVARDCYQHRIWPPDVVRKIVAG